MNHPLGKAIERRKQRGLDLTIIIGEPKKADEHEAPAPETMVLEPEHEAEAESLAPEAMEEPNHLEELLSAADDENQKRDVEMSGLPEMDVTSDMPDHEKESLLNSKPRSLMERAKLAQLKKKQPKE